MPRLETSNANAMKIHVNRVPAEGLTEHASYDPQPLDMERGDIRLDEPFTVDTLITKTDDELVVRAQIRCALRCACARCLEEFRSVVSTDGIFSYHVRPTEVVDITEDVRQEIILAYPMIPVCRPGCKGLCTACGQNLNAATCPHHPQGE